MALAAEEAVQKLETFAREHVPPGTIFSVEVTDGPLEKLLSALLSQPYEHLLFVGLREQAYSDNCLIVVWRRCN